MASGVKYNQFVEDLGNAVHNFSTHAIKIALTNTAPNVAAHAVFGDISEITIGIGNGYTAGGNAATLSSWAESSGTAKLTLADPTTWTASGGSIGPFRYVVAYNSTQTSPNKPLIGYWDYGSSITLAAGETFTADLDQANGVLTIT